MVNTNLNKLKILKKYFIEYRNNVIGLRAETYFFLSYHNSKELVGCLFLYEPNIT